METIGQEIGILIGHRLAGGTVDNHRIEQVALFYQADQAAQIERLFGFGQFVPQLSSEMPCTLVNIALELAMPQMRRSMCFCFSQGC
ncbi:Uncharacterised protein [Serratia fonticola]|uniref:Uncharacterized protein n=1 Tax=Serratia fonticola TaxID=47917 RepID=A0A4U9UCC7_SERFO|nr:Uncharacterised protein [Serratia fonticola]